MVVHVGNRQFSNGAWANMTRAEQDAVRAEVRAEREVRQAAEDAKALAHAKSFAAAHPEAASERARLRAALGEVQL